MVNNNLQKDKTLILLDLKQSDAGFDFASNISTALSYAEKEKQGLLDTIQENIETIRSLTSDCDKTDYILAISSGVLCGIIDIFLVGKPGKSPLGEVTDSWFEERTKDFAKMCKWKPSGEENISDAIRYLEKKFKVPYDQSTLGTSSKLVFDLTPNNHHFKSLGHNPSLLGLFFSILDQFANKSHFVSDGELLILEHASNTFELKGETVVSKLFCGIANWIGHLVSDWTGSSRSSGRGMGVPSPLWSWMNDIIVIKRELGVPSSEFDKHYNELALSIFEAGYDTRFQSAQTIPVFINESVVRLFFALRRLIRYYKHKPMGQLSIIDVFRFCEPFKNSTVKRMLTVAHGSFCLIDLGDATFRGVSSGGINIPEFVMRVNIVGIGRFSISLYGEFSRMLQKTEHKDDNYYILREQQIVDNYINGLLELSEIYDDSFLLSLVEDLKKSDAYKDAFEMSVELAHKRGVPEKERLNTKQDIDAYFLGGKHETK